MTTPLIEACARAICKAEDSRHDPDELFSHGMDWPRPRWQFYVTTARAVIPLVLQHAANICGSLAETTYDDADGFAAATGCEAEIRRAASAL